MVGSLIMTISAIVFVTLSCVFRSTFCFTRRILFSSDTVCRVVSSLLQTSSSGLEKLGVVHLSVKLWVELCLLYSKRLLVVWKNWENFAFQLKLYVELFLLYPKRLLVVWKNWENLTSS